MNPLLSDAARSVEMGWLLGLTTVLFFGCFLAWVWYAYTPKHQELFEDAARMPLEEGGEG